MKKKKKGFTLTELIAVIVIIALLALISIPAYNSMRKKTLEAQYKNVVSLIETAAEKYASTNGKSLINVQELIDAGLLETDDAKNILDPRDNSKLNCYLIEIKYKQGSYVAKYINKESKDDDNTCNLDKAKAEYGFINIILQGLESNNLYSVSDGWVRENLKLSVDARNLSDEAITNYSWVSTSGESSNESFITTHTNTNFHATYNVQVETDKEHKYYDEVEVKIDKEAPVIEDVEVSGGNNWLKGRNVKIKATDKSGSGIAGYYIGKNDCDETKNFISSNFNFYTAKIDSKDLIEPTTYYVCVKDAVGNIGKYEKTLTLSVKDKIAPQCIYEGGNSTWTKDDVEVSIGCKDDDSGCSVDSSYTKTFNTTTEKETVSYTIKDNAGNETLCTKEYDIYVDKDAPATPTLDNKSGGNWSKTGFFVIAESSDSGSGIAKWQYKYDSVNSWMEEPSGQYTFLDTTYNRYENNNNTYNAAYSADRSEKTYIRACDAVGNCSNAADTTIKIDKTVPSISFGTNGTSSYVSTGSTTVSYSDATSGVSSINYGWSTNSTSTAASSTGPSSGGTLSSYCSITSNGSCYLYVIVCDNAGNCNSARTSPFYIDRQGPSINSVGITYQWGMCVPDNGAAYASLWFTASDNASGINASKTKWYYNHSQYRSDKWSTSYGSALKDNYYYQCFGITSKSDNVLTNYITAYDAVGNASAERYTKCSYSNYTCS